MTKNSNVAILDIGSSKLTVLVGEKFNNSSFNIKGSGDLEYDGYFDGVFLEPKRLKADVMKAIELAEQSAGIQIDEIHIGVPGEYTAVVCKEGTVNFPKRHRVAQSDIKNLFNSFNEFEDVVGYRYIMCSPIYFNLDNNLKTLNPIGMETVKFGGMFSYFFASSYFLETMEEIFSDLPIRIVSYIPAVLAESLLLLQPSERDRYAIIIDIGYLASSVIVLRGEGILHLCTFSLGGAQLTQDLFECLDIDFDEAEMLKRKIDLNIIATEEDKYIINRNGEERAYSVLLSNNIVQARLDDFIMLIKKALQQCKYDYPQHLPLCFTGGGISNIRGAKEYMGYALDKDTEVLTPPIPQLKRPQFSSSLGVLNYAINKVDVEKESFINKILRHINGG